MTVEDLQHLNYWGHELNKLSYACRTLSRPYDPENPIRHFQGEHGHQINFFLSDLKGIIRCAQLTLPLMLEKLEQRNLELHELFAKHYGEHWQSNIDNPLQAAHEADKRMRQAQEVARRKRNQDDLTARVAHQLEQIQDGEAIGGDNDLLAMQQALLRVGKLICTECGYADGNCGCC